MTRKEIFNCINEKEVSNTIKNVAMFLIDKRHYAKEITSLNEEDLDLLIDNLAYNNEIINNDNINDYASNLLTLKQDTQIRQGKKIMLLNYYTIKNDLKDCKILLDNVNYYNFN